MVRPFRVDIKSNCSTQIQFSASQCRGPPIWFKKQSSARDFLGNKMAVLTCNVVMFIMTSAALIVAVSSGGTPTQVNNWFYTI